MHQFHEFNIVSHFGTYCTIGTNVTNQRDVCMGVLGVYTILGETTRNPTDTMVKPLDLRTVAVVERCISCLVI